MFDFASFQQGLGLLVHINSFVIQMTVEEKVCYLVCYEEILHLDFSESMERVTKISPFTTPRFSQKQESVTIYMIS